MTVRAARIAAACVILLVVASVAGKVLYSQHGFLTHDSGHYLRVAGSLRSGQGPYTFDPCVAGSRAYFAVWPLGYPGATALTAWATGTSPFVASKILNLALLLATAGLLACLFKDRVLWSLPLFFIGSYTDIAAYSWSENLFITATVLFALGAVRHIRAPAVNALLLVLSGAVLCFLSRYVGIFVIAPIAIVAAVYARQGRVRDAAAAAGAAAGTLIIAGAYLAVNWHRTGFLTGEARPGAREPADVLLGNAWQALADEARLFSLPVAGLESPAGWGSLAVLGILMAAFVRSQKSLESRVLVLTGSFWFLLMVVLRFTLKFDPLSFRLLGPGTILIVAGLLFECPSRFAPRARKVSEVVLAVGCLSLALAQVYVYARPRPSSANAVMASLVADYRRVPPGSIVVDAEAAALPLRPDVAFQTPRADDTAERLLARLSACRDNGIFLRRRADRRDGSVEAPALSQALTWAEDPPGFVRLK